MRSLALEVKYVYEHKYDMALQVYLFLSLGSCKQSWKCKCNYGCTTCSTRPPIAKQISATFIGN